MEERTDGEQTDELRPVFDKLYAEEYRDGFARDIDEYFWLLCSSLSLRL